MWNNGNDWQKKTKLIFHCFDVCVFTFSYWVECFTADWNLLWMCSLWDFRSLPRSSLRSRPSPRRQTTPGWVGLLCGRNNQPIREQSGLHMLFYFTKNAATYFYYGRLLSSDTLTQWLTAAARWWLWPWPWRERGFLVHLSCCTKE